MKIKSIESKEDIKKRQRKNQWIIGGILILVMLGSTFGIIVDSFGKNNSSTSKVEYNGYKFVDQNGFWTTTIGSYQFQFKYNPQQVERISTKLNYINTYSGTPLYVSSEDYVAEVEIYRNLGNVVQRFQGACLNETNCPENWPIKDCSNNFIILKVANESKIYQDQKCVFIEGPVENLTQNTDEYLFWITGIEK
jgi:hypothetical protein